jgi:hypothetical protein
LCRGSGLPRSLIWHGPTLANAVLARADGGRRCPAGCGRRRDQRRRRADRRGQGGDGSGECLRARRSAGRRGGQHRHRRRGNNRCRGHRHGRRRHRRKQRRQGRHHREWRNRGSPAAARAERRGPPAGAAPPGTPAGAAPPGTPAPPGPAARPGPVAPARARAGSSGTRTSEATCARWKADRANLAEGTWSGNVASCTVGDISADGRANALRLFNMYRWFADLPRWSPRRRATCRRRRAR